MAKMMLSWNQHLGRVQLQLIGLDWIPKAYQGTIRDSPPSLKWQPLPLKYKTNMTHFPYYVLSLYHHCNYHIFHSLTVLIVVSLIFRCFSLLGMHSVMALQGNPWMRKIRVELFIYFFSRHTSVVHLLNRVLINSFPFRPVLCTFPWIEARQNSLPDLFSRGK